MNSFSEPRPKDSFFVRNATLVAIGSLTILMALATYTYWQKGQAADKAKAWVSHTYEVLAHVQLLFGKLKDAELGERGYLLTGNEEYLEPYAAALKDTDQVLSLPETKSLMHLDPTINPNTISNIDAFEQHYSIAQELAILKWMTSDNPAQQSNIAELQGVVLQLQDYWAKVIGEQKDKNAKTVINEIANYQGKKMMDHVRVMIRLMQAEETRLLSMRTENDNASSYRSSWFIFGGMAIFYVSMVLAIWFYQRGRARAQMAQLHYTHELEKREEELKMQQEELKASNEEIEASNEELEEKTKALEEQNMQIQQQAVELEEGKKLIEEQVAAVERASKYKSEFLANMSHELRTPLNSLLILAKMLAQNEEGNLTEEQVEEAHVIHNGGLELLGLINDILDLSKVEAGKLSLLVEEVPLQGIVKRLQQQFAPVAKEKKLELAVQVADDLPEMLTTDVQRVEQILKNLLSNAFKFTQEGSVTLEIRRPEQPELQRFSVKRDEAIAFSVIDTGIGIEPSKFKDIFEAFQQENGSIDRHYGGTGLGLTIARKFSHMLGGEIQIASKKGEGSRFTLVLPVVMGEVVLPVDEPYLATPVADDSSRIALKPMPKVWAAEFIADDRKNIAPKDKVLLIIEDDKHFAGTLMKIARKRGYKCLAAGDGKTGLLLANEEAVHAIILDLSLPDIDGMNVLDQLKHNLKTRHIPVHIISGRDEADNVVPLRKGAIGYLTKPVEAEKIEGALSKLEGLLEAGVKKILVIEDDHKNQIAIQSLLKKKDVEITIVGTGNDGMQKARETPFDCIVLDLQLPDMTGFEWLETMGKRPLPPVIVYTARELNEEEAKKLSRYTGSIIIKGAKSPERLLDEVTLFLHSVESTLSADQQEIIRMQHNPDKVLLGRTVLLTDDDLRNTFALSKLLKAHGMNMVIADNGQMALEKLKEDPSIELVIMDIMMPIMDGYQAMQAIRAQREFKDLPIITLTARAMPEEQEKCMAAGANDYLTKPVDIERLLTLLRVWLFKQEKAA